MVLQRSNDCLLLIGWLHDLFQVRQACHSFCEISGRHLTLASLSSLWLGSWYHQITCFIDPERGKWINFHGPRFSDNLQTTWGSRAGADASDSERMVRQNNKNFVQTRSGDEKSLHEKMPLTTYDFTTQQAQAAWLLIWQGVPGRIIMVMTACLGVSQFSTSGWVGSLLRKSISILPKMNHFQQFETGDSAEIERYRIILVWRAYCLSRLIGSPNRSYVRARVDVLLGLGGLLLQLHVKIHFWSYEPGQGWHGYWCWMQFFSYAQSFFWSTTFLILITSMCCVTSGMQLSILFGRLDKHWNGKVSRILSCALAPAYNWNVSMLFDPLEWRVARHVHVVTPS